MKDDRKKLLDIVEGFDAAMLVTHVSEQPHGRPMQIAANEQGELWFVTSRRSPKADEVEDDGQALITLQSSTAYALLYGRIALVDDRARLHELWSKPMDVWFPDGPDSPDAVLLRFHPTSGQYWDMRGTKGLRYAAQAIEALVEGERIDPVKGTSGSTSL